MFDIAELLSALGLQNSNDSSNNPMISGGGIGGGQGFLSNLFKGSGTSGTKGTGINPSGLFSAAGDMGSALITKNATGKYGQISNGDAKLAAAVSGAGKGAAIGSVIPGIGTLLGGGIGAALGGLFGKGNEIDVDKLENKMAKDQIDQQHHMSLNRGKTIANNSNIHGSTGIGYFKYGGSVTPDFKAEDGEVLYASQDNPPVTDTRGEASQIGQNTFKLKGDSHSDPSGGIGVQGAGTPFVGNDGEIEETGFVFSDSLKADPLKYLNNL